MILKKKDSFGILYLTTLDTLLKLVAPKSILPM
jgi:hypothetical protein